MHSELLMVEGEKMAKSLGNYYTLQDLLDKGYNAMAVRFLLMSTHYRQQLNFTFEGLKAAQNAIERLTIFLQRLTEVEGRPAGEELEDLMRTVSKDFETALDDDLNITKALAVTFDFMRDVNRMIDQGRVSRKEARAVNDLMIGFDKVLAIMSEVKKEPLSKEVEQLIQKREAARNARDWKTADDIRLKLYEMGVILEDTTAGVKWRRRS
jgi:cysteinyl-tRNA synthetase